MLTADDQDQTPPPAVGRKVDEFLLALTNIVVDAMHEQWVVYSRCLHLAFARHGIEKWKAREVPQDDGDGDIGGVDADVEAEEGILTAQFRCKYGVSCCRANEVRQGAPVPVPGVRCTRCSTLEDNSSLRHELLERLEEPGHTNPSGQSLLEDLKNKLWCFPQIKTEVEHDLTGTSRDDPEASAMRAPEGMLESLLRAESVPFFMPSGVPGR